MEEEVESLSSILSSPAGKGETVTPVAEAAPPAAEPKGEPEVTAEAKRDEAGRFAKAAPPIETKVEPKAEKPETMVPLSALLAERARRTRPEASKPTPKTSVFDDEDKGISERVSEFVEPLQKQVFDLRLQLAKANSPDFDEAVMAFLKASQSDDTLKYQADNAPDPLAYIYREGKRIKTLEPYGGDFGKYSDSITADLTKQIGVRDEQIKVQAAEIEALKKSQTALESIPRSLNKGNESVPRSNAEADDDDIKAIARFGNQRR